MQIKICTQLTHYTYKLRNILYITIHTRHLSTYICTSLLLVSPVSLLEVVHDCHDADVGTDHAGQEADGEDDHVLDAAVDEGGAGVLGPVRRGVYEGRGHEGERGHLDRAQEGDQQVQPGHRGGHPHCNRGLGLNS